MGSRPRRAGTRPRVTRGRASAASSSVGTDAARDAVDKDYQQL
uniref:Uncharacterized protein n=1 Tax=Arundo donax TaxID=35708 RepID=A0A0A9BPH5_ARUDO